LAAAGESFSEGAAATVAGAADAIWVRGEEVQNHTAAITAAETTLASIRPNALRMFTLPTHSK
jgi:hypothetical protein